MRLGSIMAMIVSRLDNGTGAMKEEYTAIYNWYKRNENNIRGGDEDYKQASQRLIRALPPPTSVSDVEMKAVFHEILTMYLEWAYGETDGNMAMNEYAKKALSPLPEDERMRLSDLEIKALQKSRIWPYIRLGRKSR